MTDKELWERLHENAEWARCNEWETPLCLADDLTAAADAIERLQADLATVAAERDRYKAEHENPQPPTNADRIRAMDDNELAEFLMECNPANCQQCAFSSGWRCDPDREDYSDAEKCTEGRKRWLQQPAEEAQ